MSQPQSSSNSNSQNDSAEVDCMLEDIAQQQVITIDERTLVTHPWVSIAQRRRIEHYISSDDAVDQSFAISHVPLTDCRWDPANAAMIRYGIPIKVTVVGHLLSLDFHTSASFRPVYALTVDFMRDIDHSAMADIVHRWNPDAFIPEHFKACWRGPSLCSCFKRTYEALERLRPTADRQRTSFTSLVAGDVVLVETCPVLDLHRHVRFSIEVVTRVALAPRSTIAPCA